MHRCSRTVLPFATAFLVVTFGTRAAAQTVPPLDARIRNAVLDSVRATLRRSYVDADTGKRLAEYLSERQKNHAYDSIVDRRRFGQMVTNDVRHLNGDKHLALFYQPSPPTAASEPPDSLQSRLARRANFGLRKLEILDGNIGYLEVAGFLDAPGANEAIASALRFLERCDAIIIDLRRNGGGSGEMSHMLFSHFLGRTPVPTIRVRDRRDATDSLQRSIAEVPGPRRTNVPLYVLTSSFSASAAEEFAFVMRHTSRATLVGERTAGAGHMNAIVDASNGFNFSVSTKRVSHPTNGTEWERTGVPPHVEATAATALDVAVQLAKKALSDSVVKSGPPLR